MFVNDRAWGNGVLANLTLRRFQTGFRETRRQHARLYRGGGAAVSGLRAGWEGGDRALTMAAPPPYPGAAVPVFENGSWPLLFAAPTSFVLCFVRAIRLGTLRRFFRLYRLHNKASFRYLYTHGGSHWEPSLFEPTALQTQVRRAGTYVADRHSVRCEGRRRRRVQRYRQFGDRRQRQRTIFNSHGRPLIQGGCGQAPGRCW